MRRQKTAPAADEGLDALFEHAAIGEAGECIAVGHLLGLIEFAAVVAASRYRVPGRVGGFPRASRRRGAQFVDLLEDAAAELGDIFEGGSGFEALLDADEAALASVAAADHGLGGLFEELEDFGQFDASGELALDAIRGEAEGAIEAAAGAIQRSFIFGFGFQAQALGLKSERRLAEFGGALLEDMLLHARERAAR